MGSKVQLGEVYPFIYGKGLPENKRANTGAIPVYGSSGVVGYHDEALIKGPAVIIGRKGTVGALNLCISPCWPIDTTFYVEFNRIDEAQFCYYMLSTLGLQHMNSDSAVPGLNRNAAHALSIDLPDEMTRKAIASILGSLDDKIELNRQINEKLEAIAKALYKSWFTDFDPVKAKAEGRDTGLPEHISSLFPASFVDSELGQIPKGWRVGSLTEIASVISGGTPKTRKTEYWGEEIPWFSMVDYPSKGQVFILRTEKKITHEGLLNSAAQLVDSGAIILSARGTVGKFAVAAIPMTFNQSCYALQSISPSYGSPFLYFSLGRVIDLLKAYSHGSVFSTITRDTLSVVRTGIPDERLALAFTNRTEDYFQKILTNSKQNIVLQGLRDILLPKLISCELPIPAAERIVGRYL